MLDEHGEQVLDEIGEPVMLAIHRMPGEIVPEADEWSQHIIDAMVRNEQMQPDEMSLDGPALALVRSLLSRVEALWAAVGISSPSDTLDKKTSTTSAPRRRKAV